MRCPLCKGLRSVDRRHANRNGKMCKDCREGRIEKRGQFQNYWLERFTLAEIREMAAAIWSEEDA